MAAGPRGVDEAATPFAGTPTRAGGGRRPAPTAGLARGAREPARRAWNRARQQPSRAAAGSRSPGRAAPLVHRLGSACLVLNWLRRVAAYGGNCLIERVALLCLRRIEQRRPALRHHWSLAWRGWGASAADPVRPLEGVAACADRSWSDARLNVNWAGLIEARASPGRQRRRGSPAWDPGAVAEQHAHRDVGRGGHAARHARGQHLEIRAVAVVSARPSHTDRLSV
jgi:hypothetical protein